MIKNFKINGIDYTSYLVDGIRENEILSQELDNGQLVLAHLDNKIEGLKIFSPIYFEDGENKRYYLLNSFDYSISQFGSKIKYNLVISFISYPILLQKINMPNITHTKSLAFKMGYFKFDSTESRISKWVFFDQDHNKKEVYVSNVDNSLIDGELYFIDNYDEFYNKCENLIKDSIDSRINDNINKLNIVEENNIIKPRYILIKKSDGRLYYRLFNTFFSTPYITKNNLEEYVRKNDMKEGDIICKNNDVFYLLNQYSGEYKIVNNYNIIKSIKSNPKTYFDKFLEIYIAYNVLQKGIKISSELMNLLCSRICDEFDIQESNFFEFMNNILSRFDSVVTIKFKDDIPYLSYKKLTEKKDEIDSKYIIDISERQSSVDYANTLYVNANNALIDIAEDNKYLRDFLALDTPFIPIRSDEQILSDTNGYFHIDNIYYLKKAYLSVDSYAISLLLSNIKVDIYNLKGKIIHRNLTIQNEMALSSFNLTPAIKGLLKEYVFLKKDYLDYLNFKSDIYTNRSHLYLKDENGNEYNYYMRYLPYKAIFNELYLIKYNDNLRTLYGSTRVLNFPYLFILENLLDGYFTPNFLNGIEEAEIIDSRYEYKVPFNNDIPVLYDITDRILEKNLYDMLPNQYTTEYDTKGKYKGNYLYFDSTGIKGLFNYEKGVLGTTKQYAIDNVINNSETILSDYSNYQKIGDKLINGIIIIDTNDNDTVFASDYLEKVFLMRINSFTIDGIVKNGKKQNYDYRKLSLKCQGSLLNNGKLKISKNNIKDETTIVDNQNSSYINYDLYSKQEYLKINRLGNPEKTITCRYLESEKNKIAKLGSFFEKDYILYNKTVEHYKNFYIMHGSLSKYYVNTILFTALSSKKRVYQYASDLGSHQRKDIFKYRMEISTSKKVGSLYFTDFLSKIITGNEKNYNFINSIIMEFYNKNNEMINRIIYDCNILPAGRSIIISIDLKNNSYINIPYIKSDEEVHIWETFNEDKTIGGYEQERYFYVDENGELVYFNIRLINNNLLTAKYSNEYPLITESQNNEIKDIFNITKMIFKDNREILVPTIQFEFCSDDDDIIISENLSIRANFIRNDIFSKCKIRFHLEKYEKNILYDKAFEDYVFEDDAEKYYQYNNISLALEKVKKYDGLYNSISFCDEYGDLFWAINCNSLPNYIFINCYDYFNKSFDKIIKNITFKAGTWSENANNIVSYILNNEEYNVPGNGVKIETYSNFVTFKTRFDKNTSYYGRLDIKDDNGNRLKYISSSDREEKEYIIDLNNNRQIEVEYSLQMYEFYILLSKYDTGGGKVSLEWSDCSFDEEGNLNWYTYTENTKIYSDTNEFMFRIKANLNVKAIFKASSLGIYLETGESNEWVTSQKVRIYDDLTVAGLYFIRDTTVKTLSIKGLNLISANSNTANLFYKLSKEENWIDISSSISSGEAEISINNKIYLLLYTSNINSNKYIYLKGYPKYYLDYEHISLEISLEFNSENNVELQFIGGEIIENDSSINITGINEAYNVYNTSVYTYKGDLRVTNQNSDVSFSDIYITVSSNKDNIFHEEIIELPYDYRWGYGIAEAGGELQYYPNGNEINVKVIARDENNNVYKYSKIITAENNLNLDNTYYQIPIQYHYLNNKNTLYFINQLNSNGSKITIFDIIKDITYQTNIGLEIVKIINTDKYELVIDNKKDYLIKWDENDNLIIYKDGDELGLKEPLITITPNSEDSKGTGFRGEIKNYNEELSRNISLKVKKRVS